MSEEEMEILKELSEQSYFGDLPFLFYADLIGKLIANYNKEKEKRIIEFAKDEKGVVYLGVDFNENSTDLIISKCKDKITVGTFIPSNKANFEEITRLKFYTKKSVEAMIIRLTEIHEEFELLEEE